MIKLNLGCGVYYKPGYINIDMFESEIADEIADICHLEYEDNSVDEIEASHIIEHFDVITLPLISKTVPCVLHALVIEYETRIDG